MTTTLRDMEEGESNCCGAKVYMGICSDCKEHCETYEEVMETAARIQAARILGSIKTEKKSKSSAENGKLGGRPKKVSPHTSKEE